MRCNNKVEHYVVRPNTPVKDWTYEYSNGDSVSSKCGCCKGIDAIANAIDKLYNMIDKIQSQSGNNSCCNLSITVVDKNMIIDY